MYVLISADAIIQTIGVLAGAGLGAYLGGTYAVKVMNKQIDYQNEQKELDKIEKFEKTFLELTIAFRTFGKGVEETCELLLNPATEKPNHQFVAGKLNSLVQTSCESLKMINNDYIPKEVYKDYLKGKTFIDICSTVITVLTEDIERENNLDLKKEKKVISDLYNYAKEINELYEEIESFKDDIQFIQQFKKEKNL